MAKESDLKGVTMHKWPLLVLLGPLLIAPCASADIVTFGDVSVGMPTIVVGNGTTVVTDTPVGAPTADGYGILDSSYTITATKLGNIQIDWLSNRPFSSNVDSDITVDISGEVSVAMTGGGQMGLQVAGLIDSNFNPTVLFNSSLVTGPVSDARIRWSTEKTKNNVALGNNHTLEMFTSISWRPAAVGDTLQISSFGYFVGATAAAANGEQVPEPSSVALLMTGVSALGCYRLRKRRRISH